MQLAAFSSSFTVIAFTTEHTESTEEDWRRLSYVVFSVASVCSVVSAIDDGYRTSFEPRTGRKQHVSEWQASRLGFISPVPLGSNPGLATSTVGYANWQSGQVESLASAGSTPAPTTERGSLIDGTLVQRDDAWFAPRKSGFDSPALHCTQRQRTEGSRIRLVGPVC